MRIFITFAASIPFPARLLPIRAHRHRRHLTRFAFDCLLAFACLCSTGASAEPALAGRIWDVGAGREISAATLFERLRAAQVVLLGETHDNADHHAMQLQAFDAITSGDARPALVMEQFDLPLQDAMDAARGSGAQALASAGKLDRGGWRSDYYLPLIEHALRFDVPIRAANLARESVRELTRAGPEVLASPKWQALAVDQVWTPRQQAIMQREIVSGHCGHPLGALEAGMIAAQRARDASMADVLLAQAERGAVAILGRGHARKDVGVPLYLAARDPTLRVASVGLIEADPQRRQPTDYAEGSVYDYLWFSVAPDRPDPCAEFGTAARQPPAAAHRLESAPQ